MVACVQCLFSHYAQNVDVVVDDDDVFDDDGFDEDNFDDG